MPEALKMGEGISESPVKDSDVSERQFTRGLSTARRIMARKAGHLSDPQNPVVICQQNLPPWLSVV